ncbi:MAG: PDZ domain-containing protein [Tepidibacillus sp.]
MELLIELIKKIPFLFLQPMLYIGLILIILQYRRQMILERTLFSSRIHSVPLEVLGSLGYGLIGGVVGSGLMMSLGVVFHPYEMGIVWLITAILIFFHIRFLCLSYAAGILGLLAGIMRLFPTPEIVWLKPFWEMVTQLHIPSLIAIVAILHLIEAFLIRLQAEKTSTPLFIETKRGKLIGGQHIQAFWLLPLFLVVSTGDSSQGIELSSTWWPLIGGASSLTILPVPAIIGYSDVTTVYTSVEKSKVASKHLMIYSVFLFGLAFAAEYWLPLQIIAALFAALAHEGLRLIGKRAEAKRSVLFVHPNDGLRVLEVIPGSPAARMGIKSGETIKKVNGIPVTDKRGLYEALQSQSAFAKLEIINLSGHIKLVQHSLYEGDHHQLGIILAPDDEAPYYIEMEDHNLLKLFRQKAEKIFRGA